MARVVVYHAGYGCETGCCGHVIEIDDYDGKTRREFDFSHPWGEDNLTWAQNLVGEAFGWEHVADLDWDNCLISED